MLNKKIEEALNNQLNRELYASYLYFSMSAYFEANKLPGIAHWMRIQAQEEVMHAVKIYDFIHDRNGRVQVKAIDAPPNEWNTPLAAFQQAHEHEQKVTQDIYDLIDLSTEHRDHAVSNFLQWFVTEQVEEESTSQGLVDKMELIKDDPTGLFMVDQDLGSRQARAEAQ